jgi:hypothetical protein
MMMMQEDKFCNAVFRGGMTGGGESSLFADENHMADFLVMADSHQNLCEEKDALYTVLLHLLVINQYHFVLYPSIQFRETDGFPLFFFSLSS